VGKRAESGFLQQRVARQSATGCAFPARRQGCQPARPFRTLLPNLPPDFCRMWAKSRYRHNAPDRPEMARPSGFTRRFDGPDFYRILGKVNARNAGGPARLGPGCAKFPRFPCRLEPRGVTGAQLYRTLAGAYGQVAGGLVRFRFVPDRP